MCCCLTAVVDLLTLHPIEPCRTEARFPCKNRELALRLLKIVPHRPLDEVHGREQLVPILLVRAFVLMSYRQRWGVEGSKASVMTHSLADLKVDGGDARNGVTHFLRGEELEFADAGVQLVHSPLERLVVGHVPGPVRVEDIESDDVAGVGRTA